METYRFSIFYVMANLENSGGNNKGLPSQAGQSHLNLPSEKKQGRAEKNNFPARELFGKSGGSFFYPALIRHYITIPYAPILTTGFRVAFFWLFFHKP
jgi:hypothetical protein